MKRASPVAVLAAVTAVGIGVTTTSAASATAGPARTHDVKFSEHIRDPSPVFYTGNLGADQAARMRANALEVKAEVNQMQEWLQGVSWQQISVQMTAALNAYAASPCTYVAIDC